MVQPTSKSTTIQSKNYTTTAFSSRLTLVAAFGALSVQCTSPVADEAVAPDFFAESQTTNTETLGLPAEGETPERFVDTKGNRWVHKEKIIPLAAARNGSADLDKPLPPGPSREEMLGWSDERIAEYWRPVMVTSGAQYELEMAPVDFARKWRAGEFFGRTEPIEPQKSEIDTQAVLGNDDRVNVIGTSGVAPPGKYSRQVLLSAQPISATNWSAQCTAGLVGTRAALSGAHCFNDPLTHQWYPTYYWAMGVATRTANGVSTQARSFPTSGAWINGCYGMWIPTSFLTDSSTTNDFAVLEFGCNQNPGNTVGAHGSWTVSDAQITGSATELIGYPTQPPAAFALSTYQVPSLVTHNLPVGNTFLFYGANAAVIRHNVDASPGQSGAPMLQTVNGVQYVTMIHSGGTSTYNLARRFDGTVYGFLKSYTTY